MIAATASASPLAGAGAVAAVICGVWFCALCAWLVRRTVRQADFRRRFLLTAAERGFTPGEARRLWTLGKFTRTPDRLPILLSVQDFDRCVDQARRRVGDAIAWGDLLSDSAVSALRRRFSAGPARRSRGIAYSTDLETNQHVKVRLAGGEEWNAFVLVADEERLQLTLPTVRGCPVSLELDQTVHVSFWRPQDARYYFDAQVVGRSPTLMLHHAPVTRLQERQYVRARSRDEVRFAAVDQQAALACAEGRARAEFQDTALLRDISASGACFLTDRDLAPGAWLVVRVKDPAHAGGLALSAQVVRQTALTGTSRPIRQVAVKFDPLAPRAEYRLSRMVAGIEQQLISRLAARAAGEPVPAREPVLAAMGQETQE